MSGEGSEIPTHGTTVHAAMLGGLPVAVFVINAEGNPFYANRAAVELLGRGIDPSAGADTLAKTYHAYLAGTDEPYPAERMPILRALKGERSRVEDMEIAHPDGRIPIRVWGSPLRAADGTVEYAMAAFINIANEREAERTSERVAGELERSDTQLRETRERLTRHERLALLGQLAGGVSHELRQPLGAIASTVDALRLSLDVADAGLAERLDRISRQVAHAERIVTDLLDFSRVHPGEQRRTEVAELIALGVERAALPASVDVRRSVVGPLAVYVDPGQIAQAIANVLRNGAEAMSGEGELRVTARSADGRVEIAIADDGPGIDPALGASIFEPLVTGKRSGIGLGLMVVRTLVERNAGRVDASDGGDGGAVFRIELPAAR